MKTVIHFARGRDKETERGEDEEREAKTGGATLLTNLQMKTKLTLQI